MLTPDLTQIPLVMLPSHTDLYNKCYKMVEGDFWGIKNIVLPSCFLESLPVEEATRHIVKTLKQLFGEASCQ